jgi:hypothetical protein
MPLQVKGDDILRWIAVREDVVKRCTAWGAQKEENRSTPLILHLLFCLRTLTSKIVLHYLHYKSAPSREKHGSREATLKQIKKYVKGIAECNQRCVFAQLGVEDILGVSLVDNPLLITVRMHGGNARLCFRQLAVIGPETDEANLFGGIDMTTASIVHAALREELKWGATVVRDQSVQVDDMLLCEKRRLHVLGSNFDAWRQHAERNGRARTALAKDMWQGRLAISGWKLWLQSLHIGNENDRLRNKAQFACRRGLLISSLCALGHHVRLIQRSRALDASAQRYRNSAAFCLWTKVHGQHRLAEKRLEAQMVQADGYRQSCALHKWRRTRKEREGLRGFLEEVSQSRLNRSVSVCFRSWVSRGRILRDQRAQSATATHYCKKRNLGVCLQSWSEQAWVTLASEERKRLQAAVQSWAHQRLTSSLNSWRQCMHVARQCRADFRHSHRSLVESFHLWKRYAQISSQIRNIMMGWSDATAASKFYRIRLTLQHFRAWATVTAPTMLSKSRQREIEARYSGA